MAKGATSWPRDKTESLIVNFSGRWPPVNR